MKIVLTVDVDGSAVSREYDFDDYVAEVWGDRVLDMLDTIKHSQVIPF